MSMISAADAVLLIVDVQDRLLSAMPQAEVLKRDIAFLAQAAKLLEIPILATEQYSKGLGPTAAELRPYLTNPPIEKLTFSCSGTSGFNESLRALSRKQVIVTGIEAHVCVLATTLQLLELGYSVFLVADAVQSRRVSDKTLALKRCEKADATILSAESVVFEALRGADHPAFKAVSQLVKARPLSTLLESDP